MQNGLWRLVSKKETKPPASKADELEKWEMKAEKAAGEIYLLVENDQRVHFRGHEEDPIKMWELLELPTCPKSQERDLMPMTTCLTSESRMTRH